MGSLAIDNTKEAAIKIYLLIFKFPVLAIGEQRVSALGGDIFMLPDGVVINTLASHADDWG